jgi:hypothetical protein
MLLVLLFNFGFSFLYTGFALKTNRENAKVCMNTTNDCFLQVLKIKDESNFQRIDDHEIQFEGKMYDVKKEVRSEGFLYIYCSHDESEDNLLATLKSIVNVNSDSKKQENNQNDFSSQLDFAKKYLTSEKFFLNNIFEVVQEFPLKDFLISTDHYKQIFSPPPKA